LETNFFITYTMLNLSEVEGKDTFNKECSKVEQLTSKALKKAIAFRSEHPSFLLVMTESYVNGYRLVSIILNIYFVMSYLLFYKDVALQQNCNLQFLYCFYIVKNFQKLPQHFAKNYLTNRRAVFNLEVLHGRTWPVIYSRPRINGGWQKFASENNLKVGDVCVFEMIQKIQGLAFIVSIFRGAEEPSFPISQGNPFLFICTMRIQSRRDS